MLDAIQVRRARTHNLCNVDIDIPRNQLVVITGVSGSGKSSLAFDTLLAEGQRQYVQSLSIYARQFFDDSDRSDAGSAESAKYGWYDYRGIRLFAAAHGESRHSALPAMRDSDCPAN